MSMKLLTTLAVGGAILVLSTAGLFWYTFFGPGRAPGAGGD